MLGRHSPPVSCYVAVSRHVEMTSDEQCFKTKVHHIVEMLGPALTSSFMLCSSIQTCRDDVKMSSVSRQKYTTLYRCWGRHSPPVSCCVAVSRHVEMTSRWAVFQDKSTPHCTDAGAGTHPQNLHSHGTAMQQTKWLMTTLSPPTKSCWFRWTWSSDQNNTLVNSLGPSDAIWWQRSGSPLAQVMACSLMAPSHYLNQCWLIISKVEWHSSKGKFTRDTSAINHWNYLEN